MKYQNKGKSKSSKTPVKAFDLVISLDEAKKSIKDKEKLELISENKARKLNPSCMLMLPWYFKKEIILREKKYLDNGGSILIPMPYAHIVKKLKYTNL